MKSGVLIAGASFALCLGINGTVLGAEEPVSLMSPEVAQNELADNKELLMFVEEQDLVTATKRPTSLRKAPATATIITADEIRNMGARSLLDVLKMVPGVGISTNEFGANMVEVRGIRTATVEKILVMIDGHSLNKNFTGSALYNVDDMLPVENIRQVEVVRGPGSALYGNSAFVATINIITRNAEEINGVELKSGGGTSDSFKGNLVGGKVFGDKLAVSGSLDHYQTNGPELTVGADTLSGTGYSMAPGSPDLKFRQTDAFLKIAYGDFSFRSQYITRKKNLFIGLQSALTDDSNKDSVESYWGEAAYNLRLGKDLSANLKLHYDHYEQDPFVKLFPSGYLGAFPQGVIARPLVKDQTIGSEVQVDWDVFEGNHLIAGISYEHLRQYDVKLLANYSGGPIQEVGNWNKDATRQIWALYLQDEWRLPYDINLTVGVRYDHYSDFGDTVNPRIGLVWSFLDNANLKLLYGQAFRAPNFQELYNDNNPVVKGNSKLKPEKIETFEAGLGYRLNRYFGLELNYFYSTIDDLIGWTPSTTGQPAINDNIGTATTQGVELGLSGILTPELSWKANYAWQDPRDADSGRRLPYVPSQGAGASINYAPVKYVNLHTDILWTGPRLRDKGDSRPEVPDYTTVDLALTLKNFYRTLEIQATVRNLFDRRYKDPDTSGGAANLLGTGPKVPGDFPREGISAFVSASYKF